MEGGPFHNVALALPSRTFVLKKYQEFHGWRAVPFQSVALALVPSSVRQPARSGQSNVVVSAV
eukprot:5187325-Pyramimonas_sp.AAC.1